MTRTLTVAEAAELPVVLDVEAAGRLLGIGRTNAYRMVREGEFPTRVLRVGGQWRIPTADLLALLGLAPPSATPQSAPGTPSGTVPTAHLDDSDLT